MNYVSLGKSGLKISQIGLGMMSFGNRTRRDWHVSEQDAEQIVKCAATAGINFFDTADMYDAGESEQVTGRLLRKAFTSRDEFVLATKVYFPMGTGPNQRGLSRKHLLASIDNSLARLQCDYVDLYQIHRWDTETPIEETMGTLDEIVKAGKARYIGASTMSTWQFAKAQHTADRAGTTPFISMQNHYNLIYREEEREMIPYCIDQGVGVIPYSPLARGVLAGNRTRDNVRHTVRAATDPLSESMYLDSDFDIVDTLVRIAATRNVPPAQVALSWLLNRSGVAAPIIGATSTRHVNDAVAATELHLDDNENTALDDGYVAHAVTF
jgi:1-deoxyxylulose-5-phosphate synthase